MKLQESIFPESRFRKSEKGINKNGAGMVR